MWRLVRYLEGRLAARTITPASQNRACRGPRRTPRERLSARSFDFAQDFACGLRLRSRPQNGSTFTKKGAHSAIPQDALITQGLGACGSPCGLRFDPQVSARTPQGGIPRLRSGFPFGLHLRAGLADSRSAQGPRLRPQNGSTQIPRLRSGLRFAARTITPTSQNRACRGPRRTPRKRLSRDPSTSLRISLRLAPQGRLCGFPLG